MVYRAIFADVSVNIFPQQHTTLHRGRIVICTIQEFTGRVKRDNRSNFQLFACKIKGDISFQKL